MIEADKSIKVRDVVTNIAHKLCNTYCDETLCMQYAWWVLESITHTTKNNLLLQDTIILTREQTDTVLHWIDQQVKENIPLQYLIGSVPFAECEIVVEPPILIPRPETEEWVTNIITQIKKSGIASFRVLDLCTGSGCIAVALAKAFPQATIYATDISKQALILAQKNASHNNVSIKFFHADLFEGVPIDLTFDIIIANPPYISAQEWKTLDVSVRMWEDNLALIAPHEGLGLLHNIITSALPFLATNKGFKQQNIPNLLVEIGYKQGPAVKKIFEDAGYNHILIHKDLFGNDRLVSGYFDACEKKE